LLSVATDQGRGNTIAREHHNVPEDDRRYLGVPRHLVIRRCIFVLPCLLIFVCRTRWKSERWLLAMIALATIAPYVWIRMEERFWVPASFAYMILAAVAIECFLEGRQAKHA